MTSRLRVLWAIKGLGRGGAEQLLVSAARVADHDRFRYEACYVLPHKHLLADALADQGVVVHRLGEAAGGRGTRWAWPWRLRRLLAAGGYDVVHVHSPVLAAVTRLAVATLPGRRAPVTVYTQHNVWQSYARATRAADALTHRRDRHRFAVSRAVAASNPARLRATTELLVHGVPLDAAPVAPTGDAGARTAVRAALGVAEDAPLVVTVANLRATKDHATLLEAARAVHAARPDARFLLVGDGPLRQTLEARRDMLGLDGVVCFLGTRDDVPDLLAAADLFVLSSRHEGVPVAMMEAMVAGLPCVLTAVGGIPDVVGEGQGARLVPAGEPAALAGAVLEVLTDDGLRRELAERARAQAARFDIATAVRGYERVYAEVAG